MKTLKHRPALILTGLIAVLTLTAAVPLLVKSAARTYGFEVVNRLPHDPRAYTQGLLYHKSYFYESTGLYGESSLRKADPQSGWLHRTKPLSPRYFGEGLALVQGVLVQLTWKAGKAFVYNSDSFDQLREFSYNTEGWGLTFDGRSLIMSDGSDRLYFRDPTSFKLEKTVSVTDGGRVVRYLNELEFIEGEIWANVYQTFDVVRIDPASGEVLSRIDFSGILSPEDRNGREDVLNGIAYDPEGKRIFVTGKRYSFIYEIRLRTSP